MDTQSDSQIIAAEEAAKSIRSPDIYHILPWLRLFPTEKRRLPEREYLLVKRIFDVGITIACAPLWFPVLLTCILMIKLSSPSKPALYVQMRTGKDGRRFRMFKLRTMVPDADRLKQELMALNELHWPDFKITNDPRVTRIGKFLRRTSLDELPQLLNVLQGNMSLVGPRPTSFTAETYDLWHTERLDVLPGMTGLWQLVGRGSTDFDERLRLDIAYITHRSFALDFVILLRTFSTVLKMKGVH